MKTIFQKSYMIRAQAEKAAVKAFGDSWVQTHEIYARADIMPTRWAIRELATIKARAQFAALVADAAQAIEEFDEDELERFADKQRAQAEKKTNATMAQDNKPRFSTCERPTKKVWHIADAMPKASRKAVIAECVAQGIAYGTARTQYQAWFKASQECFAENIRKPYEKA